MFATTCLRPTGLAVGAERLQPWASSGAVGLREIRASAGNSRVVFVGRRRAQDYGVGLRLPESSLRLVKVSAKKSAEEGKEKDKKVKNKKKKTETEDNIKVQLELSRSFQDVVKDSTQ